MATIQNRSPLIVTVPRKPELRREFRYDHLDDAEQYMRELAAGTHTAGKRVQPKIEQGTTSWEVRCRDKGFPDINVTFATEKEARDFEELVRVERKQGIVKDYNRAHGVTYADMLVQHLATHRRPKTFDADFYKIAAWLNDSGPHGQKLLEKFRSEHPADAKPLPALKHAMREPMKELEWIHKRLNAITAQDINGYVRAREKQVAPATVDREIDLLTRVFARAQRAWDYDLHKSPTLGIERPQYNNERDRRLRDNEEELLVAEARREDTKTAVDERVEFLLKLEFGSTTFSSLSAQKKVFAARRKELRPVAEQYVEHEREQGRPPVPWVETFLQFQLMTAARRGEATGLPWRHVVRSCVSSVMARAQMAMRGEMIEFNGVSRDPRYIFRNRTLVDLLQISSTEQGHLKTIIDDSESKRRDALWHREHRRAAGARAREEVDAERDARKQMARQLRALGWARDKIAAKLGVSVRTVDNYLQA